MWCKVNFVLKPNFLNMEPAFKYVIWEFLEHNLTSETQLLAAVLYGTVLMINANRIPEMKLTFLPPGGKKERVGAPSPGLWLGLGHRR